MRPFRFSPFGRQEPTNKALNAEPPIASFLKSMLVGDGPVNASIVHKKEISVNRINQQRFRLFLALAILCSCVGCDQATKTIAMNTLRDQPPRSFFADTVRFDYAQNPGGFLSLGASLPHSFRTGLFIATNWAMLLGLLSFLVLKRNIPFALFVSLVCVFSGGVGNLIDRVSNSGLVIDFINIGIGPIRTGVFNVADVAITFGAISIGLLTFKREADEQSNPPKSPLGSEFES